jgi:hypothetical protein
MVVLYIVGILVLSFFFAVGVGYVTHRSKNDEYFQGVIVPIVVTMGLVRFEFGQDNILILLFVLVLTIIVSLLGGLLGLGLA